MTNRSSAACLLLLGGCAVFEGSQPSAHSSALALQFDQQAPAWLAKSGVPSLAVAYIADGRVAWTRAYGETSPGVPATTKSLYNVASLTKPVFAEVILRAAAEGKLSLDESMSPHWIDPDLAGDARHRLLTPRIALSHRTGFANWRRDTGGKLVIRTEPGSSYGYSGEGFEYASMFVQRKLGASLDQLGVRYVFGPLGMRQTTFSVPASAADDLQATVGDYGRFVVAAMARPYAILTADPGFLGPCDAKLGDRCPERGGYGLGWSILEWPDETVVWHTGADTSERTMAFWFPKRRAGAVFFTNSAKGFDVIIDAGVLLFPDTAFAGYLMAGKR